MGWTDNGKLIQSYLGTFARRVDVERYLTEHDGTVPESANTTVDHLYKQWIKNKIDLSEASKYSYQAAWK